MPDGNVPDLFDEGPGRGRPTSYKPEYAEQARKLCYLGATNADLADFFGVNVRTVERWLSDNEIFRRAVKGGKKQLDDRVERSLYHRAVGYQADAVKIFMPAGSTEPVYAPYRENVQPDTTAAIFWLKNRRPEQWRETSAQTNTVVVVVEDKLRRALGRSDEPLTIENDAQSAKE